MRSPHKLFGRRVHRRRPGRTPTCVPRLESLELRQMMAADSWDGATAPAAAMPANSNMLRELDVVHLGGSPSGPLGAYLVSAAGTGAEAQLTSWKVTELAATPSRLADGDVLEGRDIDLHVLSPTEDPELARRPFVASRIGSDDHLWLTGYRLSIPGNFVSGNTLGYGSHGDQVIDHAIAHRPAADGDEFTQVVTALATKSSGTIELHVVTWQVDNDTQEIQALENSGPLANVELPDDGGDLAITHMTAGIFAVNYQTAQGNLGTRYVGVADNGAILDAGGGESGFDYDGDTTSTAVDKLAMTSLSPNASVTVSEQGGEMEVSVWERRINGCFFLLCSYDTYRIGHSSNDARPNDKGVALPIPEMNHRYHVTPGTNESFGSSIAVGDFNGDGYQDLAASAPNESVDGGAKAGAVTVIYGSADGLYTSLSNFTFDQDSEGIAGKAEANDRFGFSLAAGDFNGDGRDDLALGTPYEAVEADGLSEVGVVQILYGSASGISAAGNQLLRQGEDGVEGISESFDRFGWTLAAGDFNNDGRDDLVVGVPFEDHIVGNLSDAGAVQLFLGSDGGLSTTNDRVIHQNEIGIMEDAAANDQFGYALAVGDFDNDGHDDLTVGVPGKKAFGWENAGGVHLLMGTAAGIGTEDWFITQDGIVSGVDNSLVADISDSTEEGDRFGSALASADFNGDGFQDLAIGAPDEGLVGLNVAGRVHALYGSANGIVATGEQVFDLSSPSVVGEPELGGRFGFALAGGDVDGDDHDELLVGVPYRDSIGSPNVIFANSGSAVLLQGTTSGLTGVFSTELQSGAGGLSGAREPSAQFGYQVLLEDLNGDGRADGIIGIPNQDRDDFLGRLVTNAGAVQVVYAESPDAASPSPTGLSEWDQTWSQGLTYHARAMLSASAWERDFGIGQGTLFELMPADEQRSVHAASVTKVMTLLLTVEALEKDNSPIKLTDPVQISQLAADTGGSAMEPLLEEGDTVPLETLLYGVMFQSCNKASVAVAEYVAQKVYGASVEDAFDEFVKRMNDRADELMMTESQYGHPAGAVLTTPQDQITLWREGWRHTLFRKFATGNGSHEGSGVTKDGDVKNWSLSRSSTYIGFDGYKGGDGKVGSVKDENDQAISAPACDSCYVAQATRADHSLIVGIQQSSARESDAKELFDFGFARLFTPDRRGRNPITQGPEIVDPNQPQMGTLIDVALDHITDSWVVTAAIDDQNQLQLSTWDVSASAGTFQGLGGTIDSVDGLIADHSAHDPPASKLDIARIESSGKVVGDYVTARVEQDKLRLDVWRLGAELAPPEQIGPLPGDFSGNQHVGEEDIQLLSTQLQSSRPDLTFDLNGDRQVNSEDLDRLIHSNLKTHYGDANLDGLFNSADLVQVFQRGQYEDRMLDNSQWSDGDWNGDGEFDSEDIVLAFQDGAYSAQATALNRTLRASDAVFALLGTPRKRS